MTLRKYCKLRRLPQERTGGDKSAVCPEHTSAIGLAGRIVGSWSSTWRTLVLVVVIVAVVVLAQWLVPMAVEFGPVRITRL